MVKYKSKIKDGQLYVRVKLPYGEKVNDRELNIFSEKYVDGFLKTKLTRKKIIEYTGPVSIKLYERLKRPMSRREFFLIIEQMVIAVRTIQEKVLSLNNIVLDINCVFINETTKEIRFIYLPIESRHNSEEVIHFIETITYSVIPMQNESSDCFTRFIYFLKNMQKLDIGAIERYIAREEKEVVEIIKMRDELTGDEETEIFVDDEETGLFYDEETLLLNEGEHMSFPTFCRMSTNEKIYIRKAVFRIGKDRKYVDYAVVDNDLISRKHVDIISRDSHFFVMDLKSKNRTRVNGQVIPEQCEVEIFDKDRITLANEEFIFEC